MISDRIASEKIVLDRLVAHGLIIPLGVDGVFGRGPVFEDVLTRFSELAGRAGRADSPERLHFPPVIPRNLLENSGFLNAFPHLAGTIFSFEGNDGRHREMQDAIANGQDWSAFQHMTDVALASAACYPVYATAPGILPAAGRAIDVTSYCFRHEPSADPTRMQSFRMREFIRLGTPERVASWRESWMERGVELLSSLGLPVRLVTASDPFFGRVGRMLASNQREQKLKFEAVVPVISDEQPTAVMSFNYHGEHFSSKFGIRTDADTLAHTACLGFGLERITMALFTTHGFDPRAWPSEIQGKLWASQS
ncbi:MAG: amino acid--[acyl-carrier-protein] ligase [Chloroflexota bacterium]